MSRYIDAEKFVEELRKRFCEDCDDELACWLCGIHKTIEAIEDYPAADVAPVVHGHWKNVKRVLNTEWGECSNCGRCNDLTPYCPQCGAKMDESEGE